MRPEDATMGKQVTLNRPVNTIKGELPIGTRAVVVSGNLGSDNYMLQLTDGTEFRTNVGDFD